MGTILLSGVMVLLLCTVACTPRNTNQTTTSDETNAIADALRSTMGSDSKFDFERKELETRSAREEFIAVCMAEAGFTYHPDAPQAASQRDELDSFGISTNVTLDSGAATTSISRNDAYVASLGREERRAYEVAMLGELAITDAVHDGTVFTPEELADQGGCRNEAALVGATSTDRALATAFSVELEELAALVSADPRVLQAQQDWATCIAREGFPFQTPAEIQDEIVLRLDTALAAAFTNDGGTDEQRRDAAPKALVEVQDYERELFALSTECSSALREVHAKVQHELLSEFVQQNLPALTSIVTD
jgi:hypothetical protein